MGGEADPLLADWPDADELLLLEERLEGAVRGIWGSIWGGRPRLGGAVLSKCCEFNDRPLNGGLDAPEEDQNLLHSRSKGCTNF